MSKANVALTPSQVAHIDPRNYGFYLYRSSPVSVNNLSELRSSLFRLGATVAS